MFARKILYGMGTLLLVVGTLSGCGESATDSVSQHKFTGRWVEDIHGDITSGQTVVRTKHEVIRELIFNEDGTYKFTIYDLEMKPLSPAQSAEGTWKVEGKKIIFTTTNKNLTGEYENCAPYRFARLKLLSEGQDEDSLLIQDDRSIRVQFVRPAAK